MVGERAWYRAWVKVLLLGWPSVKVRVVSARNPGARFTSVFGSSLMQTIWFDEPDHANGP